MVEKAQQAAAAAAAAGATAAGAAPKKGRPPGASPLDMFPPWSDAATTEKEGTSACMFFCELKLRVPSAVCTV